MSVVCWQVRNSNEQGRSDSDALQNSSNAGRNRRLFWNKDPSAPT